MRPRFDLMLSPEEIYAASTLSIPAKTLNGGAMSATAEFIEAADTDSPTSSTTFGPNWG